jgi:hypothetical protein
MSRNKRCDRQVIMNIYNDLLDNAIRSGYSKHLGKAYYTEMVMKQVNKYFNCEYKPEVIRKIIQQETARNNVELQHKIMIICKHMETDVDLSEKIMDVQKQTGCSRSIAQYFVKKAYKEWLISLK